MAEIELADDIVVDDEPKPKIVGKAEIEAKAKEIKERTELPKKPGSRVQFRELKDWLNLLTPEQEEQVMIYMYRLDPPIIRQKVNPDALNNIDVIGSSGFKDLTEDYIKNTQGGGKYQLTIKNLGYKPKVGADNSGYFECVVTVPYILMRPKMVHIDGSGLDLREVNWDDPKCQAFKAWAMAQGYVNKDGNILDKTVTGQQTTQNSDMVPVMKMMMEFVTKMSEKDQDKLKRQLGGEDALTKSMGELMLEKMKQEDPNKQMSTMTTLITAIMGQNKNSGDSGLATIMPMFTALITSMQDSANKQFQMMMALLTKEKEGSGGETKESGNEIEKLRAMIELAKEIKGGNVQRSTAEVIVDGISNNLGPVLGIVGNIVALRAQQQGIKTVPVSGSPMDVANEQNKMNTQQKPQQQQTNAPGLAEPEHLHILRQFAPLIYNNLTKDGWDFADGVEGMFPGGEQILAKVTGQGVDNLLVAIQQIGQVNLPGVGQVDFYQQVMNTYGEAHLRKWLDEFCRYKAILAEIEKQELKDMEKDK